MRERLTGPDTGTAAVSIRRLGASRGCCEDHAIRRHRTHPATRPGRRARARLPWRARTHALAGALLAALALAGAPASLAAHRALSPLAGTALWVAQVPPSQSPAQLAGGAVAAGAGTLFIKAADGSLPDPQFSAALAAGVRAAGVSVCAWTFAYGLDPLGEARAAVAAVRNGAQCLIVDAEGQYDGRYGAAQLFVHALRAQLGAGFPIGLAGQAEVSQHPGFPYSVILGPGGFQFDLPQMYWRELGVSVDVAYAKTIGENSIYARPILPVGQLFGEPLPSEVIRFRSLARASGASGVSFFDLESAQASALAALKATLPRVAARAFPAPTLRAGADSDQVLWAQELLNAAGAHLPVGGFLGAQTIRAVASFQARHRLRANGLLGAATWKALERFHAREPSWQQAPPDSARVAPGA